MSVNVGGQVATAIGPDSIADLRAINPTARIGVKLVAGRGVGGGLGGVLGQQAGRGVAVVTFRGRVVTAFLPPAVILLHHVTVGARLGIVGKVGVTAGVNKRVRPNAQRNAQQDQAKPSLRSSGIVIVVSDGWDRGDPALVATETARLRRNFR